MACFWLGCTEIGCDREQGSEIQGVLHVNNRQALQHITRAREQFHTAEHGRSLSLMAFHEGGYTATAKCARGHHNCVIHLP